MPHVAKVAFVLAADLSRSCPGRDAHVDLSVVTLAISFGDVSAVAATAAFAEEWVPVSRHHNLQRLAADARKMIQALEAVAQHPLEWKIQYSGGLDVRDEGYVRDRKIAGGTLELMRRWTRAIELADRRILPGLARHHGHLASQYIRARDAALKTVVRIRCMLALMESKRDDLDLGVRLVPATPPIGDPAGPIPVESLEPALRASHPGPYDVALSEAALLQLAEAKARAEADQTSAHAMFWSAATAILAGMSTGEAFSPNESYRSEEVNCALSHASLGRARFFFAISPSRRRVVLLLVADCYAEVAFDVVTRLHERLRSSEWDRIFDELGSYVRPTERGRTALLQAADGVLAAAPLEGAAVERIKARLVDGDPEDPIFVEDARAAFDSLVVAAEDLLDDEDADAAMSTATDGERLSWGDVRDELT